MKMQVTLGGDLVNATQARAATNAVASMLAISDREAASQLIDAAANKKHIVGVWSGEASKLQAIGLPYLMMPETAEAIHRIAYWSPVFGELLAWREADGTLLLPVFDMRAALRASQKQQARFLSWIDGVTGIPPIGVNPASLAALESISWRRIRMLNNERSALLEAALKAVK